jgi:hypothetical protein
MYNRPGCGPLTHGEYQRWTTKNVNCARLPDPRYVQKARAATTNIIFIIGPGNLPVNRNPLAFDEEPRPASRAAEPRLGRHYRRIPPGEM